MTELFSIVVENLHVEFTQVVFYTDSKVVLGYINNQSRRFYTYVSNRVQKIRLVSTPKQWRYICSEKNPADIGTRGSCPQQLKDSMWLLAPSFLQELTEPLPEFYPLVDPQSDSEVRNVVAMVTCAEKNSHLGTSRFRTLFLMGKVGVCYGCIDAHCPINQRICEV